MNTSPIRLRGRHGNRFGNCVLGHVAILRGEPDMFAVMVDEIKLPTISTRKLLTGSVEGRCHAHEWRRNLMFSTILINQPKRVRLQWVDPLRDLAKVTVSFSYR